MFYNKKYFALIILALLLIFAACNSVEKKNDKQKKSPSQVDYMHKEVIRIHDEVMPRMQEISSLQEKIKRKTDSLSSLDNVPTEVIEELKMKKLSLDATAASMMKWMKNYREPKEKTEQEAMQYLEQEKEKIEEIANDFKAQISKSKAYLEQLERGN
ncbi:MAG: hypothetical protein WD048_14585 [Chitinophagales bacterium]